MVVQTLEIAIMFADLSGSTRLYEVLGDSAARARVARCVDMLCAVVAEFRGSTLKTIGDGIMCTFPTADAAVEAACAMQSRADDEATELTPSGPLALAIRVGLHVGPAIIEDGDAFGDAVNIAARMGALAKPGQIITTRETVARLSADLRQHTRFIDHAPVRGKRLTMDIHEILWQPEDVTMMSIPLARPACEVPRLHLRYRGTELMMDAERPVVVLGRSTTADVPVEEPLASRLHVRIEQRRGKYYLTDLSTNGTHVRSAGTQAFLRREEMLLGAQGEISLGRPFGDAPDEYIRFTTESPTKAGGPVIDEPDNR
jgi:class 3 adenylate cyclase